MAHTVQGPCTYSELKHSRFPFDSSYTINNLLLLNIFGTLFIYSCPINDQVKNIWFYLTFLVSLDRKVSSCSRWTEGV